MLTTMPATDLHSIAKALVAPNKGILAADESFSTIEKRFTKYNIENTEENRRAYRELLFTTPGAEAFISGVILFEETLYQKTADGTRFVDLMQQKSIIPGIKVDEGLEAMSESPEEKVTKGLESLPSRLPKYYEAGARFAKWRAVITIGENLPTDANLQESAQRLAKYAKLSQDNGIVPIVEPEVLMDGSHTIEQCMEATDRTLQAVFAALKEHDVLLEGMLLKPNMVISGKACPTQASVAEIAEKTIAVLKKNVPSEVPGIVFLSGGQDDVFATTTLNAINQLGPHPWEVSYSYGRALQDQALKTWTGKPENIVAAQKAFYKRAKLNSAARNGSYSPEMENQE